MRDSIENIGPPKSRSLEASFAAGMREQHLSASGTVIEEFRTAAGALPPLPARVLEDCSIADQQAMGLLQSRDSALYACFGAVKVGCLGPHAAACASLVSQ